MPVHALKLNMMNDKDMEKILQQLAALKDSALTQKKLLELTKKAILDTNDVAYLFNRRPQTIHEWRRNKQIFGTKINGRWFYSWKNIADLLNITPDSN